jgi:quercetin dioxygenase-like cupin family protein
MSQQRTGFIVASHQGPTWDMEAGRPATFKLLSDYTGGGIAIFEEIVPPLAGTPLHIHRTSDEAIYVVSGQFSVRLGETTHLAWAGSWIFVPLGTIRGWRNSGAFDGRMFYIFSPAAGARAFDEMRHRGKPIPEIAPAVRDEILAQHGFEFVADQWE